MKQLCSLILVLSLYQSVQAQNVGIGTNTPNNSSILELSSTNKGLLLPRVADTSSISAPVKGLQVYSLASNKLWYHDGTRWLQSGNGNSGDTIWHMEQDTIAYSSKKYVAINTDLNLGAIEGLQANGNLLIQGKLRYSTTPPTAAQVYTMTNLPAIQNIPATDSVFRVYDPGGTGNYNNSMQGNVYFSSSTYQVGLKLSSSAADFGLGTGDTIWLAPFGYPACRTNYTHRFTSTSANPANLIVSGSYYLIFRSNADGSNNKGFNFLFTRLSSVQTPQQVQTVGPALLFNSSTGSFAVGENTMANGNYSTAFGLNAEATGAVSFAAGFRARATSNNTIAMGYNAMASGIHSLVLGPASEASGESGIAIGSSNLAEGAGSIAIGMDIVASGDYSAGLGTFSTASGQHAVVLGNGNEASGLRSIAMGDGTKASGTNTTALGTGTTASGDYSFAAGRLNTVTGFNAAVFGESNAASGIHSAAFGLSNDATGALGFTAGSNNTASGYGSTAMGFATEAAGKNSTTLGDHSIARGYGSTVVGMYNDPLLFGAQTTATSLTPLFIVGNGTDLGNRSNAMVIMRGGNVGIGINNPSYKLEVDGNVMVRSDDRPSVSIRRYNNIGGSMVIDEDDNMEIGTNIWNTTGKLLFSLNSEVKLTIDVDGNATLKGNATFNKSSNTTLSLQANDVEKGFVQLSGNDLRMGTYSSNSTGRVILRSGGSDKLIVDDDGDVKVTNDLLVKGNKGIMSNANGSASLKYYTKTVSFGAALAAFGTSGEGYITFPAGVFTTPPQAIVGDIVSTGGTSGQLFRMQLVLYNVTTAGCAARLINTHNAAIDYSTTWNLILIGD